MYKDKCIHVTTYAIVKTGSEGQGSEVISPPAFIIAVTEMLVESVVGGLVMSDSPSVVMWV